jgi:HAD superfamily hydrolase (TIGR01549 family)
MLKAVLFDMDGVLIDSNKAWYTIFNKTLEYFENKTISRKEFDEVVWAKNFNETVKKYFSVDMEQVRDFYGSLYEVFMNNLTVFPDTKETLKELKEKNLKLALVTNTHRDHAVKLLKDIGIFDLFDYIIGADQVKNGKPEPDIILKTLKDMKLKKEEVVYVGDTIWDKIASEKADVKFIGVRIEGDERIEKLYELLKVIW